MEIEASILVRKEHPMVQELTVCELQHDSATKDGDILQPGEIGFIFRNAEDPKKDRELLGIVLCCPACGIIDSVSTEEIRGFHQRICESCYISFIIQKATRFPEVSFIDITYVLPS